MHWLDWFRNAELDVGGFLVPWSIAIGFAGFLCAWAVVSLMERAGLTRLVWHLPLFFVALAVFFGSIIGLVLAP